MTQGNGMGSGTKIAPITGITGQSYGNMLRIPVPIALRNSPG